MPARRRPPPPPPPPPPESTTGRKAISQTAALPSASRAAAHRGRAGPVHSPQRAGPDLPKQRAGPDPSPELPPPPGELRGCPPPPPLAFLRRRRRRRRKASGGGGGGHCLCVRRPIVSRRKSCGRRLIRIRSVFTPLRMRGPGTRVGRSAPRSRRQHPGACVHPDQPAAAAGRREHAKRCGAGAGIHGPDGRPVAAAAAAAAGRQGNERASTQRGAVLRAELAEPARKKPERRQQPRPVAAAAAAASQPRLYDSDESCDG